jgi:hypothetical protein
MKRIVACVVLVSLLGCSSVAEPEPEPETPPVFAQADSVIAAMDREVLFMTQAGAGGTSDPECQTALRAYYAASVAYAIAIAAVRAAPSAANIAMATYLALVVMNESTNVYNQCSSPTRPA